MKEYKTTIIFVIAIVLIIGAMAFLEFSKERKAKQIEEEVAAEKQAELDAAVAKYKSVEETENYPIATITMEDEKQIVLKLYPNKAPTTVENFISLANSGFYDGLTFHRTIPNFVIQGGDKEGTGSGLTDYKIKGEFSINGFTPNDISHKKGVISMARSSSSYDSAGTQFFIVTQDNDTVKASLDGNYAGFGEVIEGMDVVTEIANVEVITTDQNSADADRPVNPPVIKSITVDTKGVEYAQPEKIVEE